VAANVEEVLIAIILSFLRYMDREMWVIREQITVSFCEYSTILITVQLHYPVCGPVTVILIGPHILEF